MSSLVFEQITPSESRLSVVTKKRTLAPAVAFSRPSQRYYYQQIEVRPVSYPFYRNLARQWQSRVRYRRFCQDDHNHIVQLPWGDWHYRPLAERRPQPIAMVALLRLIAGEMKEFHYYGAGIGYLAQLVAAMRDFEGMARIFALDLAAAAAAQSVAEQLGLLRHLRVHGSMDGRPGAGAGPASGLASGTASGTGTASASGTASGSGSGTASGLAGTASGTTTKPARATPVSPKVPRPEVMRLDLACDPRLIPLEINETIAEARPLILATLAQQPSRTERSLSWFFGNGYRLFTMGVSPGHSAHNYHLSLTPLDPRTILNHAAPLSAAARKNLLAVPEEQEQRWLQR